MKPFVLKQHEKDFAKVRELRETELALISGGLQTAPGPIREPIKLNTLTVTPDHDGGDDGKDEG